MSVRLRKNTRKTRAAEAWWPAPAFLVILLTFYVIADRHWQLPRWVGAGYLLLSLICFVLFAWDKLAAVAGRRRIPENKLLFWSLLGGWPGAILAQTVLRHKIHKTSFRLRFWSVTMLHIAFLMALVAAFRALFF